MSDALVPAAPYVLAATVAATVAATLLATVYLLASTLTKELNQAKADRDDKATVCKDQDELLTRKTEELKVKKAECDAKAAELLSLIHI